MRIGIKARFTLTVFLVITLLLAALAVSGYRYFVGEFKKEINRQQVAMITLVARQIDRRIGTAIRTLAGVAGEIPADALSDAARIRKILDDQDLARAFFDGGFLATGPDGRILAESPSYPGRQGRDWRHRDFVRETLRTGKPFVSAPYLASVPPYHPTVTVATPLFGRDGKPAGVLAGRHDLLKDDDLTELARTRIGKTGYLFILDRSRTLVMHPDARRILEHVLPGRNLAVDRAIAGTEGAFENVNSRGVAGLTAFRPLGNGSWIVFSHYPLAEAYAPLVRARRIFTGAMAAMIAFALAGAWTAARTLTKPLIRLTDHVNSLPGKTGPGRTIEMRTGDEFESLGDAFNAMILENDRQRQALLDDQEIYKILAEFPSEFVMLLDAAGGVRYISPNCASLTGYEECEFRDDPKLIGNLVHPDDRERWRNHRKSPGEDGVCSLDFRIVHRSGQVRWFSHSCRSIPGPAGGYGGSRGSFREITNRITLERMLKEQSTFLETLLESTSTPMFVIGADHRILSWNRALAVLSGFSSETMVGTDRPWLAFYPTERPTLADLVADGQTDRIEALYSTFSRNPGLPGIVRAEGWYPDVGGKERYLFFDAAPVHSPEGKLIAVVETLHDITERKLAEQALRDYQGALEAKHHELERVFALVEEAKREWEHTQDCIDDMVLLAGEDGRVRRCNKAFTSFVGKPYRDVVGNDWQAMLESAGLDLALVSPESGEIRHPGSGRWYLVRIYPYGSGRDLVVSLHDFTVRRTVSEELAGAYNQLKETHMQLLQQEKMASIGQLAAGVAHEINNPMGFISSNLGALGKYAARLSEFIAALTAAVAEADPGAASGPVADLRRKLKIDYVLEDIPKLVAESREGAERVRVIVQNLKSFSRVDEAKVQPTDLNACVESTITIVWNELKYKADLVREFGDLPPVTCNAQQVNQVFMNLLVNAAHAIENHGTITVRSWAEDGTACVSVRDTGCGIPEGIRSRIFEPFFTTKEVGKGTGLGLSISYDIVKRHGGSIDVESEPGSGTTFTVRIPIAGPTAA